jgi:hypothetical protein
VSTKPRSSVAISAGSHSVWASAPMKMYRPPDASCVVQSPPLGPRVEMSIASSDVSPRAPTTCVWNIMRMFGLVSSCWTR